jgi:hypothetical protein
VFADDMLGSKPTDFNDLYILCGMDEVRRYLGAEKTRKKSSFEFTRCDQIDIK